MAARQPTRRRVLPEVLGFGTPAEGREELCAHARVPLLVKPNKGGARFELSTKETGKA